MRNCGQLPSLKRWCSTLFATAFLAGGAAHATVPVTSYLVVQPIDVCSTSGASGGCAPFNTSSQSPNPATATSTTTIGFLDTTTNINITRAIWLQAGIDVTFLPMLQYNNSNYQAIDVFCSSQSGGSCTQLGSNSFKALTTSPGPAAASGCVSNCLVPIFTSTYQFANANAIPMFFINSITPTTPLTGNYYGFGWVNGSGVAISKLAFFQALSTPHFDTLAHEIGHNLGLDHITYGAPQPQTTPCPGVPPGTLPNPGGCNVMDAGTIRIVPANSSCNPSTSNSGGALWELDTRLCTTTPPQNPIADQLILGSSTSVQQGQALQSGFLNTQPNVNAIAGGGGDLPFQVTNSSSNYIAALILSLPAGYNFVGHKFQLPSPNPSNNPTPSSWEVLHGNNGAGNNNCQKAIPVASNPSFQCLEIDFPVTVSNGTFTTPFGPGVTFSFNANIHNETTGQTVTSTAQMGCTTPLPLSCLDLSEVFTNLYATTAAFTPDGFLSSQFPDPTVGPVIVNPANFPTLANLNPPPTFTGSPNPVTGGAPAPCTPDSETGNCPPLAGGDNPITGNSNQSND
jgi:hypothetical protein